jgi:predicted  nucleic acid-binding Zn-ribbon protein
MAEEGYERQAFGDSNTKIANLEEKQRILRDQVNLLGQNLVESKERTTQKIIEIRKDIESLKQNVDKISSFLENISGEFSKFAKKEDLEILTKQAKMFQPLEFVTKRDLEKLKNN